MHVLSGTFCQIWIRVINTFGEEGNWFTMTSRGTASASSDSCGLDAPSSLAMRSMMSFVLSVQTLALWHISLIISRGSIEHSSVLKASNFFTDLAKDATLLSAILKQVSAFSMQVQDLLLANATVAVGIVAGHGPRTDPSNCVKKSTMQLIRRKLFSVLGMGCHVLAEKVLCRPGHIGN